MCVKWNKTACDAGTTATSWFIIGQYMANKFSLPQGQSYTERKYFLRTVKKYFLSVKLWPWGRLIIGLYKITKIVCALWLAERRVCMRDVNMIVASRCFAFRALITQSQIWKPFWVENSTHLLYLYPFPRQLKLGKSSETCCVNFFFRLS